MVVREFPRDVMVMGLAARPPTAQCEVLSRLGDGDLLRMVRTLPREADLRARACETLIGRYQKLVRSCVRQYQHGPESAEELMQVGYVGLLKAINNFSLDIGGSLSAYAQPRVTGEIKRHFRAGRLGVGPEDLREARRGQDPVMLAGLVGADDQCVEQTVDMAAVSAHWRELPVREQRILTLRFWGNLTQAEIGERLGISRMHVSRLLTRALGYLRDQLLGSGESELVA